MAKTQHKLTEKVQQAAADILCAYIFAHSKADFNSEFFQKIMKQYNLYEDPFTCLPCTPKEYVDSSLEYDRQTMIEKYGYCDGLE